MKIVVWYIFCYTFISNIHAFHFKKFGYYSIDPRTLNIPASKFLNYSNTRPNNPNLSCYMDEDENWMCIYDIWNVDPEDSY